MLLKAKDRKLLYGAVWPRSVSAVILLVSVVQLMFQEFRYGRLFQKSLLRLS